VIDTVGEQDDAYPRPEHEGYCVENVHGC
jgi:hypothetical protein